MRDLQNRLGFVVSLAREVAEREGNGPRLAALRALEATLEKSRLAREDTLGRAALSEAERHWSTHRHRPRAIGICSDRTARRCAIAPEPPPPWHDFLRALDAGLPEAVALHCLGGFVVAARYGLLRPTADLAISR